MKKIFITLFTFFTFIYSLYSQTEMSSLSSFLGLGVGLETSWGLGGGIAFRGSYEKGFIDVGPGTMTLGGEIGLGFNFTTNIHASIGLRSCWFYNLEDLDFDDSDKLNFYAGGSFGISHYTDAYKTSFLISKPYTTPYFSLLVGANYFVQDNMAVFVEEQGGFPAAFTYVGIHIWH